MLQFVACYKFLGIVFLLASVVYCFTHDEVEIFQLQQELARKYGADIDFYRFLKLPKLKDSTSAEISKNFRKLARKYHPDKNPKHRKLYERINLVTKILTDEGHRKTYDYYLKNGFPKYDFKKGGFFFNRVTPSVWFTFLFLYVICGLIHLVLLRLHNNSNKKRIENFITNVKKQDSTQGLGECKLMFKESEESEGKQLLVKLGEVFVVQPDETIVKITTEDIKDPGIKETLLIKLPLFVWNNTVGRLLESSASKDEKNNKKSSTKRKNSKTTKVQ